MPRQNLNEYSRSVFVNCPYDNEYLPFFRAIVFTIMVCEFRVRCALEIEDVVSQIEIIYPIIKSSKFGVHDLSRTQFDSVTGLPRFNMPLELGVFLGAKEYGIGAQRQKRAVILDVEPDRFQKLISNLKGMTPRVHRGDPERCIRELRDWLATVARHNLPSPTICIDLYRKFTMEFAALCVQNGFEADDISYTDFVNVVAAWLLKPS